MKYMSVEYLCVHSYVCHMWQAKYREWDITGCDVAVVQSEPVIQDSGSYFVL